MSAIILGTEFSYYTCTRCMERIYSKINVSFIFSPSQLLNSGAAICQMLWIQFCDVLSEPKIETKYMPKIPPNLQLL